jgi:hypothetical protein
MNPIDTAFKLSIGLLSFSVLVQTVEGFWILSSQRRTLRWLLIVRLGLLALVAGLPYDSGTFMTAISLVSLFFYFEVWETRNGGSDAITLHTLIPLTVACWFLGSPHFSKAGEAALGWIALQACASYFIAGLVKVRRREWLTGEVLKDFAEFDQYGLPTVVRQLAQSVYFRKLGAWAILIFELGFPVIFFAPKLALPFLGAGACFHLLNVWLFGLNRFFWAWLATYPAIWFWSGARILTP